MKTDPTIEALNSLLRGELSAIETFSHAIHKFPEIAENPILKGMRSDHLESAGILRDYISTHGGDPSTDSGVWGGFAKAIEGTASLFGNNAAILALSHGEKHGISEYDDALKNEDVSLKVKNLIRDQLLPPLHRHVLNLQSLSD